LLIYTITHGHISSKERPVFIDFHLRNDLNCRVGIKRYLLAQVIDFLFVGSIKVWTRGRDNFGDWRGWWIGQNRTTSEPWERSSL